MRAHRTVVSRQRRLARRGDERGIPEVDVAQLRRGRHQASDPAWETDNDAQRDHPRRRLRHPALPGDAGHLQAVAARVRQADDLLSAVDADARRDPRHPAHLDAGGHAAVRAAPRRRRAVGTRIFPTPCSRRPRGSPRRSSSAAASSGATRRRSSSATTFFMATTSRPSCVAPERAPKGRPCSRIRSRIRSATAWPSSTRPAAS